MEFADRIADKREQLLRYVMQQLRVNPEIAEDIEHDTIAVSLQRQEQFLSGEYEAALVNWLKTTAFRKGLRVIDPIQRTVDRGMGNGQTHVQYYNTIPAWEAGYASWYELTGSVDHYNPPESIEGPIAENVKVNGAY
jgi:hypothetical protein